MAISAPSKSAQYTNLTAVPPVLNDGLDHAGLKVAYAKLTFTAAGFTTAAAGDLKMLRMPAGKVRIYSDLCRLICPIGTGTSDLDVGIGPYIKTDGTVQALQGNLLADSLDVGGGALDQTLPLPTAGIVEVESKDGFDVVASFDTANSPAAGDFILAIVYQKASGE